MILLEAPFETSSDNSGYFLAHIPSQLVYIKDALELAEPSTNSRAILDT